MPNTPKKFPQYPGYSNAGIVINIGQKVKEFKPGDRVVSKGGHSSHILVSHDKVLKIPTEVSFDEAVFFSLGSIALQGVRKAGIELGESIVVIGQGLIGLLALQLAKLCGGMPIIAIDLHDYRLDLSLKLGADYIMNPRKVNLEKEIAEITENKGADITIEASGNPNAIPLALKLTGKLGRVVLLGSPRGLSKVNFYSDVHKKGISIIGAHASIRPQRESFRHLWTDRDDSTLILSLFKRKKLKVRELITTRFRYTEAKRAYNLLMQERGDVLGIILDWSSAYIGNGKP